VFTVRLVELTDDRPRGGGTIDIAPKDPLHVFLVPAHDFGNDAYL
jgi:hypothetical protein